MVRQYYYALSAALYLPNPSIAIEIGQKFASAPLSQLKRTEIRKTVKTVNNIVT